jgi:hypothetical protein
MMTGRARRGERGVMLIVSMLVMAVVAGLAQSLLFVSTTEDITAHRQTDRQRALALAEAGTQRGKQMIKAAASLNSLINPPDTSLTNVSLGRGKFTVTFANDAADPGGATNDTNNILVVTSAGTVGTNTRRLETAIYRRTLPPLPGAMTVNGTEGESTFSGVAFDVNGNDFNPDDTAGPKSAKVGVSAINASVENDIYNRLSTAERNQPVFRGLNGDRSPSSLSLKIDASLTSDATQALAEELATLTPAENAVTINRTTMSVTGTHTYANGCGGGPTNPASNQAWGCPNSPGIFYVKGISQADYNANPAGLSGAMTVSGNFEGAGVLILDGADLSVSGNFRWEGLIIVTGPLVGFRIGGGGNQKVYGGVVINERATDRCAARPDCNELILLGNPTIKYSSLALDRLQFGVNALFRTVYWREG